MSAAGLAVEIARLRLAYGGREVLRGVDLRLAPGERACLIGPNGAGKSSLLRCLTGLLAPTAGEVLLDGSPVATMGRSEVARRVAVVPGQASLPFAMRVEEVVALGRVPHEHPLRGPDARDRLAVARAMERVGLDGLRGRDARELSLGERQLVLLAMALAQEGRLLVLDEPTVHLDLRHQVEVLDLLVELSEGEGLTVLTVLHDLSLAAQAFPRLVLLDRGAIVADGPPGEVLTPARIRDIYGVDPRYVSVAAA